MNQIMMKKILLSLAALALVIKAQAQDNILPVITFDMDEFMAHQQMMQHDFQRQHEEMSHAHQLQHEQMIRQQAPAMPPQAQPMPPMSQEGLILREV